MTKFIPIKLDNNETLTISTANSTYQIKIICRSTGEVQVVGGRHFPETTRATLLGASVGSLLKVRTICVGLCVEFLHQGRRIVTSPAVSIAID